MAEAADRIRPWDENPLYWQMGGEPVVLIGGSVEDNLFQIADIEQHLDLLAECGGNYVRCTMSSRDEGDVWPFEQNADGLYDLDQPGREYWERFERFCELTSQRGIVAQIELWDRFDFSNAKQPVWDANPFNPRNNVNYTADESGLPEDIRSHPSKRESPFFRSVPALENNETLLRYQHAHIDKLMSVALNYGNLLYCMDNETNESPEWGAYWSRYIKERAIEAGVEIFTTEMWDAHDITSEMHQATWKHPETYDFCDISQNNHSPTKRHADNIAWFREQILESGRLRPINTVKIYGANTYAYGTHRDAQERFWRNIFGGLAATRFHRPPAGLGLSEIPQIHLRSMRMLLDRIDVPRSRPANDLVKGGSWNEAYCIANPPEAYAVFFPDGGHVRLDVAGCDGELAVHWLDIRRSEWHPKEIVLPEVDKLWLTTPREEGYWAVVVTPNR